MLKDSRAHRENFEPPAAHEFEIVSVREKAIPGWKQILSLLGMPLEEEAYAVPVFPFVSVTFMLTCICIFLFFKKFDEPFMLDPNNLLHYRGLNFFTYSLIHGGLGHITSNMLFITPFIDNVEHKLGHFKTFLFIVMSAFGAGLLHMLFETSRLPLIGASGVCFAIATYYAFSFQNNRLLVTVPLMGYLMFRYRLRVSAWTFIIFYLLMEFLGVMGSEAGTTRISHFGHIGGAAVGLFFYFLSKQQPDPHVPTARPRP